MHQRQWSKTHALYYNIVYMVYSVFGQAIITMLKWWTVNWKYIIYSQGQWIKTLPVGKINQSSISCFHPTVTWCLNSVNLLQRQIWSAMCLYWKINKVWYRNLFQTCTTSSRWLEAHFMQLKFGVIKVLSVNPTAKVHQVHYFKLFAYMKLRALIAYIQSYLGNDKNRFPCQTICKNNFYISFREENTSYFFLQKQ